MYIWWYTCAHFCASKCFHKMLCSELRSYLTIQNVLINYLTVNLGNQCMSKVIKLGCMSSEEETRFGSLYSMQLCVSKQCEQRSAGQREALMHFSIYIQTWYRQVHGRTEFEVVCSMVSLCVFVFFKAYYSMFVC